ncbi:MAG TPA: DUF892 family protein [Armatimonadota bacterium]|jgi:ferritin-like metal-binding protein YciE
MTTRDHLIAHVQDMYAFARDYLPVLHAQGRMCRLERLRDLLGQQHADLRDEMETLERVLNLLSARFTMERSPIVPGLEQASRRFRYRMNPSREQLDLHLALETLAVSQLIIGKYQGEIELARAIGEQDVVLLLQENLTRQEQGQRALRQFLPTLLQEAGPEEIRRVA